MNWLVSKILQNNAKDIKNNAWVTVNNDFWSRVGWFANDFHEWRSHEWKLLANHHTSAQKKSLFMVMNVLFNFLHTILYLEHTVPLQTNNRSLISPLSLGTVFTDMALWCHHSWSARSREREPLALWCHICQLFLHAQTGTKAIFTSE